MENKIVTRGSFTIVGCKYRGKLGHTEIPKLWDTVYLPRMGEIQHRNEPLVSYGVTGNYDPQTTEYDYVAGAEVTSTEDVPPGMVVWQIPAQTYAVFPCSLPEIGATLDHLYQTWLPSSPYEHAEGPDFEYYDTEFTTASDPAKAVMYVFIPIKNKGS